MELTTKQFVKLAKLKAKFIDKIFDFSELLGLSVDIDKLMLKEPEYLSARAWILLGVYQVMQNKN